jgi:hypothetical protein
LLIAVSLLAAGNVWAQVTMTDGNVKTSANILGFGEVRLFATADITNAVKKVVLRATGSILCTHPDFEGTNSLLNPNEYHHVEMPECVLQAKSCSSTSMTVIASGNFPLIVRLNDQGMPAGFHYISLFLPGIIWDVSDRIPFGYEDKVKKTVRYLQPGRYKIGPYGSVQKLQEADLKPQQ